MDRMVRLALFDIDGTLIHSGGAGLRAFRDAFETVFRIPNGTTRLNFAGRTDSSLARELMGQHGIEPTEESFERFFVAYLHWLEHHLHRLDGGAHRGVWDFLKAMRMLVDPPLIGLLTGNLRLGAELKLRRYGLWEEFRMGAFGDEHEDRNALAGVAKRRGERLMGRKLEGEEVLVIGDTPRDIECARAIGAKVLAVATGDVSAEVLAGHGPDWLVGDLGEIGVREVCQ